MPDYNEKQIPPRVADALRVLGTENEWYVTDLPPEIGNADMLRELDINQNAPWGLIEYAWLGTSIWASPYRKKPIRCSTWEQIIARKDERAFRPRIQLSELGKYELHRLQEGTGAANKRGRPRRYDPILDAKIYEAYKSTQFASYAEAVETLSRRDGWDWLTKNKLRRLLARVRGRRNKSVK